MRKLDLFHSGTGTGTGTAKGSLIRLIRARVRTRAGSRTRSTHRLLLPRGLHSDYGSESCRRSTTRSSKLDVYRAALDFVALADEIVGGLPRGRAYLADQLHRAATSICLIAEGAGEFSSRDKARFYRMARRSATECAAVLDVFARIRGW